MDSFDAQCLIQLNGSRYGMEVDCLESNLYLTYNPDVHVHPAYHLIFISKGGNLAEIGSNPPVELKLNSLLFINPLVPHRFEIKPGGEVEHTSLIWRFRDEDGAYALFPLQRLRGIPDSAAAPYLLTQISLFDASLFIRKHRQAVEARFNSLDSFRFSMLSFELFFLGLDLIMPGQDPAAQDSTKRLVSRIKALIERDMVLPSLDIPHIAEHVKKHPNYINTLFKRQEGVTINSYIRSRRVELAKSIMQSYPTRPIADVARLCGFAQHSYFTRTFQKLCSCAPAEYRDSTRI